MHNFGQLYFIKFAEQIFEQSICREVELAICCFPMFAVLRVPEHTKTRAAQHCFVFIRRGETTAEIKSQCDDSSAWMLEFPTLPCQAHLKSHHNMQFTYPRNLCPLSNISGLFIWAVLKADWDMTSCNNVLYLSETWQFHNCYKEISSTAVRAIAPWTWLW